VLLAACIEELWFSLISLLISLLIISCPPRHMGLGFVSHPLFLLLPPIVSAPVATFLCPRFFFLHLALVWEAWTRHPWVWQYPLRSKGYAFSGDVVV